MTRVSLSALRAALAKMTPGEWRRETDWHVFSDEYAEREIASTQFADDAAGIVATHNAADVLIEIAEAALAVQQARAKYLTDQSATYHDLGVAYAALDAAPSKVAP